MTTWILVRPRLLEDGEEAVIRRHFAVTHRVTEPHRGDRVLCRMRSHPNYHELAKDLEFAGVQLLSSSSDEETAAMLGQWAPLLTGITPDTWERTTDLPEEGPFVLRGDRTSRRELWKTHMFAATRKDAIEVYLRLANDGMVGHSALFIRRYVPLHPLCESVHGMPIGREFRLFMYEDQILAVGFYWMPYADQIPADERDPARFREPLTKLAKRVASRLDGSTRFYTADLAQTADGRWIVIEINAGSMSGLSGCDPEVLYTNLAAAIDGAPTPCDPFASAAESIAS